MAGWAHERLTRKETQTLMRNFIRRHPGYFLDEMQNQIGIVTAFLQTKLYRCPENGRDISPVSQEICEGRDCFTFSKNNTSCSSTDDIVRWLHFEKVRNEQYLDFNQQRLDDHESESDLFLSFYRDNQDKFWQDLDDDPDNFLNAFTDAEIASILEMCESLEVRGVQVIAEKRSLDVVTPRGIEVLIRGAPYFFWNLVVQDSSLLLQIPSQDSMRRFLVYFEMNLSTEQLMVLKDVMVKLDVRLDYLPSHRKNPEIVREFVIADVRNIAHAWLFWDDARFVFDLLKHTVSIPDDFENFFPLRQYGNPEIRLLLAQRNIRFFESLTNEERADREVVLEVVRKSEMSLSLTSVQTWKDDESFLREIFNKFPLAIKQLEEVGSLQVNNKDLWNLCLLSDVGDYLENLALYDYLPDSIATNPYFVIGLFSRLRLKPYKVGHIFTHIPISLMANPFVLREASFQCNYSFANFLQKYCFEERVLDVPHDLELTLSLINEDPNVLLFASDRLRSHPSIVLKVLELGSDRDKPRGHRYLLPPLELSDAIRRQLHNFGELDISDMNRRKHPEFAWMMMLFPENVVRPPDPVDLRRTIMKRKRVEENEEIDDVDEVREVEEIEEDDTDKEVEEVDEVQEGEEEEEVIDQEDDTDEDFEEENETEEGEDVEGDEEDEDEIDDIADEPLPDVED